MQMRLNKHLQQIKTEIPSLDDKEILKKIFSLIDLTTLSERDNIDNVTQMCEKVNHAG